MEVMIPSRAERAEMLCYMCNMSSIDAEKLAVITPGFVPADLQALYREACICHWRVSQGVLSV